MPEALKFTDAEKLAFRAAYAPAGATDDQWHLFINECQRRALVPGKDVIFQLRTASEYDRDLGRKVYFKKVTFITTIGGLRLIAQRDGHYEGHGPFVYYYGSEGGELRESKIPLGKIPHAVSVEGYRKDWRVPLFATARYDAYVQMFEKDDKKIPTGMWSTRGEEQLAKCCEAGMLRTVAPEECAGLLIKEELGNDGVIDKEDTVPVVPAVVPAQIQAPQVNQTADAVYDVPLPSEPEEVSPTVQQEVTKPTALPVPIQKDEFKKEDGSIFPPMTAVLCSTPAIKPTTAVEDRLPLEKEHAAFLARASKLVRDKLPAGGIKGNPASDGVKAYLLKGSGKTGLKQLTLHEWERLLGVLEAAPPEDAVAIVKAAVAK